MTREERLEKRIEALEKRTADLEHRASEHWHRLVELEDDPAARGAVRKLKKRVSALEEACGRRDGGDR